MKLALACVVALGSLTSVRALAAETLAPGAEYDGFFEPYQITKIASQAPGILDEILVTRGDIVKKGQVIARFRSGVERATVDYFRAKVEFGSRKAGALLATTKAADLAEVAALVEAGAIAPVVERTYRLEESSAAMAHLHSHHVRGKLVIEIA